MSGEESQQRKEFNDYIKSIGGLKNGYFPEKIIYKPGWVGDGWLPILKKLIEDLIELGWNKEILDIKEKFGGLRFYIHEGTDEIYNKIIKAEQESYKTCENCGQPGQIRNNGWYKTLCDNCNKTKNS